jgi:hypothetical protein
MIRATLLQGRQLINRASKSKQVKQKQLDMALKRPEIPSWPWRQRALANQQPAAAGRRTSSGALSSSASSPLPGADAELPALDSHQLKHQATQQHQEPQGAQPAWRAADSQHAPQQPLQGLQAQEQQAADEQEVSQQPADQQQQQCPTGVRMPAGPVCHVQQATQQQLLPPPPNTEISNPAAPLAENPTWSQLKAAPFLAMLPDAAAEGLLTLLRNPKFRPEELTMAACAAACAQGSISTTF